MARKRVIYQSEALFVSNTGTSSTAIQLHRVQSANYSFDISRTDVNEFGQLARIDSLIIEQPTVSLDFTYYPFSGQQEKLVGFDIGHGQSCISNILSGKGDALNYFIATSAEGGDINAGSTGNWKSVIGLGNMSMTSYSVDGSVGDFVSASVSAEGLNMIVDTSGHATLGLTKVTNPAVTVYDGAAVGGDCTLPAAIKVLGSATQVATALQPHHVTVDVTALGKATLGLDTADLKVQSFSVGVDLGRTPLEKLGSRFAFSREIDFPVTATLDFSANIGEMNTDMDDPRARASIENMFVGSVQGGAPAGEQGGDADTFDINVCVKPPSDYGMDWRLKGCKLDAQSFSSSIGDNKSVDFSFSTQIGGPQDTANGLIIAKATSACSANNSHVAAVEAGQYA